MKRLVIAGLLMILAAPLAFSQDEAQRARIEEERRQEFDKYHQVQDVLDEGFFYDYGGWWRTSVLDYEDSSDESHTLRDNDVRLYLDLKYGRVHQVYLRGIVKYTDYSTGDSADGNDDDFRGPNMDQAYYRMDVDELFKSDFFNAQCQIRVGRQFLKVGDGFIFNRVNDGVYADFGNKWFTLEGSASKTNRASTDFDQSRPKAMDSKRNFYTGQLTINAIPDHHPFAYVVVQRDNNNGDDLTPTQDYDYNSEHYGIGSDGQLFFRNLHYHTEVVWQQGESTATGATVQESIDAWGAEVKIDYLWDKWWFKPRFNAGYITGSGDKDRRSITNTVGGNALFTDDESFLSYGYTDTGFSFAPRSANLHIWNFGWSTKPLSKFKWFKDFQTGSQIYWYKKRIGNTVISDPAANRTDKDAGWEWDSYVNWRVLSDLSISLQYGQFHPGDAFTQDDTRHFFSVAFTYSF